MGQEHSGPAVSVPQRSVPQTSQIPERGTGLGTELQPRGNAAAIHDSRPGEPRGGCSHQVSSGESLWSIATDAYGTGTYWTEIRDACPEAVRPGNVILVGDTLIVPMALVEENECAQPDPAADTPAMTRSEYLLGLIHAGQPTEAAAFIAEQAAEQRAAMATFPGLTDTLVTSMPLGDALTVLEELGVAPWPVLLSNGATALAHLDTDLEPALFEIIAANPEAPFDVRPFLSDNARYAAFLFGYEIPPQTRVQTAGFDIYGAECGAAPVDFDLLVRICTDLDGAERTEVLMGLRRGGRWEDLVQSLGPEHVVLVQQWLGEDLGDETDMTLQERIDAAHNSARGANALAAVDAVAATDTNDPPRISPRVRELLALGVALPRLEGQDLSEEGVLGVAQAERAAQALIAMPVEEYLRTAMLLTVTDDQAQLTQSFLLLEAVAARAGRFSDDDDDNDTVQELEQFSDDIRGLDQETLITLTSVTATQPGETGLQQMFTMSCAPTSGVVMRAEADPIEALAINRNGTSVYNAGGSVAAETETALERYPGNVAQLETESRQSITDDVNDALTALVGTAPADQIQAVRDYVAGNAFDAAKFALGMNRVRGQLDLAGYPNDQAMRLLRETQTAPAAGASRGMGPEEIATEYNLDAGLNVDAATGATYTANIDATLRNYRSTLPGGNYPDPLPLNISNQVDALLATAATDLERGLDVGFGVLWSGSGGHAMSFTNVRGTGAGRSFLIHNTGNGDTGWVTQADLRNAKMPGVAGRGLVYRLADPT